MKKIILINQQIDLRIMLGIVILISVIYCSLSITFFWNSSARTTIAEIRAGMNISNPDHSEVDTTKPIKANDIDNYSANINKSIQNIDDFNDFGQESVSDSTLGL